MGKDDKTYGNQILFNTAINDYTEMSLIKKPKYKLYKGCGFEMRNLIQDILV
jgi:hypothetical protein